MIFQIKLLKETAAITTNPTNFSLKTYWRRVSGTSLPIIKLCLIVKQFLYYSFINLSLNVDNDVQKKIN